MFTHSSVHSTRSYFSGLKEEAMLHNPFIVIAIDSLTVWLKLVILELCGAAYQKIIVVSLEQG